MTSRYGMCLQQTRARASGSDRFRRLNLQRVSGMSSRMLVPAAPPVVGSAAAAAAATAAAAGKLLTVVTSPPLLAAITPTNVQRTPRQDSRRGSDCPGPVPEGGALAASND